MAIDFPAPESPVMMVISSYTNLPLPLFSQVNYTN
jgi:hypothetical protein